MFGKDTGNHSTRFAKNKLDLFEILKHLKATKRSLYEFGSDAST